MKNDFVEVEVIQERNSPRFGALRKGIKKYPRHFAEQIVRQGLAVFTKDKPVEKKEPPSRVLNGAGDFGKVSVDNSTKEGDN